MKTKAIFFIAGVAVSLVVLVAIMATEQYGRMSDIIKATESMGRGAWLDSLARYGDDKQGYDGLQARDFSQFNRVSFKNIRYSGIYRRGYAVNKHRDDNDCIAVLFPETMQDGISLLFNGGIKCVVLYSNGSASAVAFSRIVISDYSGWNSIQLGKSAQQVDAAEASTIAVPPSKLSGSPR